MNERQSLGWKAYKGSARQRAYEKKVITQAKKLKEIPVDIRAKYGMPTKPRLKQVHVKVAGKKGKRWISKGKWKGAKQRPPELLEFIFPPAGLRKKNILKWVFPPAGLTDLQPPAPPSVTDKGTKFYTQEGTKEATKIIEKVNTPEIKIPEFPKFPDIGKTVLIAAGIIGGIYLLGKVLGGRK
jgi:hypothetical protein